jgi:UDP-N-acetylmuramate--alanine ligase
MVQGKAYFFCGIGGSGMLPLALVLLAKGARVSGSDRAHDQGRTPQKFEHLRARGITLRPQDGSGVTGADMTVVASAAVEAQIPDVVAARRVGAQLVTRANLLAALFNEAPVSIGVAGTSGKTTTTGMIGWILHFAGADPTIINGGVMKNFADVEGHFASSVVGAGAAFVSEVDESDGSIAQYSARVAVLNNVALDHKSMDELRALFRGFVARAEIAVLNLDNPETAGLTGEAKKAITYSLADPNADFLAGQIEPTATGISFSLRARASNETVPVAMQVPGRHNVANALAAIAAASTQGIPVKTAAAALAAFKGIRRRLEPVGTAKDITVIDDFAHNPDKIAATLATLHDYPGRLLVMFQPHGFGPLRLMKNELIECFARNLASEDVLLMPAPVYFGGTVERTVTSTDIVEGVRHAGRSAEAYDDREGCRRRLLALAHKGDRIVIMGARDDTLSEFAQELVSELGKRA